jgi:hypothetical protein
MELDMRKLFTTAAVALALATPARADQAGVEHNGSLMMLTISDRGVAEIRYDTPRPRLPVAKGALLFTGQYDRNAHFYVGVAFVYKRGCDPVPYSVQGSDSSGAIVLVGSPPVRDSHSCAINEYTPITNDNIDHGKNVKLIFNYESDG